MLAGDQAAAGRCECAARARAGATAARRASRGGPAASRWLHCHACLAEATRSVLEDRRFTTGTMLRPLDVYRWCSAGSSQLAGSRCCLCLS
jgi:hypothetical protein